MRKFLVILGMFVLLLVSVPVAMLATGTISSSSLRMMLNVMTGATGPAATVEGVRSRYRVPEGFALSLYAKDLPRARFLKFTDAGDLLVSRPHAGDIVLLRKDANGDGLPDAQEVLLEGLNRPLGLAVHGGWLYIAESNRVGRVLFDDTRGTVDGEYHAIIEGLTDDGNHWSKTIGVGPDNKLYLAQGSTCNVCEEEDERRASMMRFSLDGSAGEIVATGLRNSVGFAWAPWNNALYATDNGRDLMGDDFPPCELNRIVDGGFYGWPYFNGANIPDPDMGVDPQASSRQPIAPEHPFRAHNAPLGISFIDPKGWPGDFQRSALVALHGSWNRSEPDGYKVVSLHFSTDGIEEREFLAGFNRDGDISGRPVDIAQGPDGAVYISDDFAGAIYRVQPSTDENGAAAITALPTVAPRGLDDAPPPWLAAADLHVMAERGAALYEQHNCRSCHEDGTNPLRLEGLAQRLGYIALDDLLQAPPSPMPDLPLSEEERRQLAVFLLNR